MFLNRLPTGSRDIDVMVGLGFLLRAGKGEHRLLVGSGFKGRQCNGNTGAFRKLGGASCKMALMPRSAVARCRKRFPDAPVPRHGTESAVSTVDPRQCRREDNRCVICS